MFNQTSAGLCVIPTGGRDFLIFARLNLLKLSPIYRECIAHLTTTTNTTTTTTTTTASTTATTTSTTASTTTFTTNYYFYYYFYFYC